MLNTYSYLDCIILINEETAFSSQLIRMFFVLFFTFIIITGRVSITPINFNYTP